MAFQLVYSSVPAGLVAGRSGFCTVARHREIREALVASIEGFSNIFDRGPQAAEDNLGLPVIYSFRCMRVGTVDYHVLSRIQEAGSDYSGRGNHIAHSFVLEPGELESLNITPAEAILALEDERKWDDSWTGGDPCYFGESKIVHFKDLKPQVSLRAQQWEKSTGAAANAARPWESGSGERTYLVFDSGASPRTILQHIAESELVRDPDRRNSAALWSVPFTTHLQASDDRSAFQWSVVKPGTPAHAGLGRSKGNVIEVSPGLAPPTGDLAKIAEGAAVTDLKKAVPESGPATISGTAKVAVPAVLGGAEVEKALPPGGQFDQKNYDNQIESMIGGGEKKKEGGPLTFKRIAIAAGIIVAAGLLWSQFKGDPDKDRLEALRVELDTLLDQSKWEAAKALYRNHPSPEDWRGPEMAEPMAALKAADRFTSLPENIHTWVKEEDQILEAGPEKNRAVSWSERPNLEGLWDVAEGQLKGWMEFKKLRETSWSEISEVVEVLESEYKDPVVLDDPSTDKLRELVNVFPPGGEDTPAVFAENSIGRLEKARAIVKDFAKLVDDARKLKPDQDGAALMDKAEKLFDLTDILNKKAEGPEIAPFKSMLSFSLQFDPIKYQKKEEGEKPEPKDMTSVKKPDDEGTKKPEKDQPKPVTIDLPLTYLVMWHHEHQYHFKLSEGSPNCKFSKIVVPYNQTELVGEGSDGWAPIIKENIRESLAGSPRFIRSRSEGTEVLSGQLKDGFETQFNERFLIRFRAAVNGKTNYQVVVTKPSAPGECLVELPVRESLSRSVDEDGAVVVRLSDSARGVLEKLVPGQTPMSGAELRLKVLLRGEGGEMSSLPQAVETSFPVGELVLPLVGGGGIDEARKKIEKDLSDWTGIDQQRKLFEKRFEKANSREFLYKNTYWIGSTEIKKDGKVVGHRPTRGDKGKNPTSPSVMEEGTGERPPFVDFLTNVVVHVLNDTRSFNMEEGADADTEILTTFQERTAGWKQGKFDGVRKAILEVAEYAKTRELRNPESKRDFGFPPFPFGRDEGEGFPSYLSRLRSWQNNVNTDRFFENWANHFSEENLNEIWIYFQQSGRQNIDKTITDELKKLNDSLSRLDNQKARAKELAEAPLADLGNWTLELEVPGVPVEGSPTPPNEIIRLVRFTKNKAAVKPQPGVETLHSVLPENAGETGEGK